MIKKFVVSICLFFALISFAQEGTSSPYSFYGIGDVKFKGTVENRSMSGLSIFGDSIHLNLQNPASLGGLKLTSFSVGGNSNNTRLKSGIEEEKSKRTTLDYLAVGLPLGKLGASFGLIPYSSVGYKILNRNDNTSTLKKFYGDGGINKVFLGFGYHLSKNFNIGLNLDYNFGKINTKSSEFIDNVQFGSREINTSSISGVNITTGLMYQSKFKGKIQIFGGLTYAPESSLNVNNSRNIQIVQFSNGADDLLVDDSEVVVSDSKITIPSKTTFGFGLGQVRKWQVGTEIVFQNNSKLTNRFDDINNVVFENSTKISIGGFYIPKYNSFNSYFKRVTYRGGFNYQNTGLVINGKAINDQAFTVGVGLPLGGTFSSINIGFEFGKRGTRLTGLVQENYNNLSIGLSFNDKWFKKTKYD